MVTKIIACADIHIPTYKGIDDVKKVLSTFIEQCKEIVKENGKAETRIVVCGDLVHNKISITNESVLATHWFLQKLNSICKTIVIAGNHDFLVNNMDRVDSIKPILEIGSLKNVTYLDAELNYKSGILMDDNIAWCLYSSFDEFNRPDITMFKEAKKDENLTYVGLIHGDVNGAITATNYVVEHGLDSGVFEGCDFVVAGHIHKRQEIKKNGVKIVYCSSIKQTNMGESVSGHGFVLWDVEKKEYEYVDTPNEDSGFYKFEIYGIDDINEDFEELINL